MENASKALLIAGAILLAIVIVSLGFGIYQYSSQQASGSNLSSQEKVAFNSQWEKFAGKNKTASEVASLCSAAIAHNASEKEAGTKRYVTVQTDSTDSNFTSTPINVSVADDGTENATANRLSFANRYEIEAEYSNGLIIKLTIKSNT